MVFLAVLPALSCFAAKVAPFDFTGVAEWQVGRWSEKRAWEWYQEAGPIVGCNYLPRSAVNMTEMWQVDTFDPGTIDQELGWAQKAGYNSIRVFLQYVVWKDDPAGMKQRLEQLLTIADKHKIRVMLVPFFDESLSCPDRAARSTVPTKIEIGLGQIIQGPCALAILASAP